MSIKKSTNEIRSSSLPLPKTTNEVYSTRMSTQPTERTRYSEILEGSRRKQDLDLDAIPSQLNQAVEELDVKIIMRIVLQNAERRFSHSTLTKAEKEEYKVLLSEYKKNEKMIPQLVIQKSFYQQRDEVFSYYNDYIELKKQQMEEINVWIYRGIDAQQLKQSEEEFLQKYKIKELSDMKKVATSCIKLYVGIYKTI